MKANDHKPFKPTVLDRIVSYFAPEKGLSRVKARQSLKRKYEGASTGRRTEGWFTNNASSQKETLQSLEILRQRSRDLIQNNAYAKRAIDSISYNVIGKGILAQIRDQNKSREKKINLLWKAWAESKECDSEGTKNFYNIQNLVQTSVFENGETFIIRRRLKADEYKNVPLGLQIIEADHLDTNGFYSKPHKGNKFKQGIEFDAKGKRVAYHFFKEHPGSIYPNTETVRINAKDVIHVYPEIRVGQIRGLPLLAPAIIKLKDFDEYADAKLLQQKIAACFAAFIKDMELPEDGEFSDEEQELIERIEPGTVEILPPGKDVSFATPPSVEGSEEFSKTNLRAIAGAIGISYEALSMDYSNVNFSSGRMGWIEMHRSIENMRANVIIPKFLTPVFDWFLEAVSILGYSSDKVNITWTPPKREMIDPTKEIPAMIEGIRAGLYTISEVLQSLGKDPEDHLEKLSEDFKLLDKLGLKLISDPRNEYESKNNTDVK